jgi:hypothetical protein
VDVQKLHQATAAAEKKALLEVREVRALHCIEAVGGVDIDKGEKVRVIRELIVRLALPCPESILTRVSFPYSQEVAI